MMLYGKLYRMIPQDCLYKVANVIKKHKVAGGASAIHM
jgi:hypothetical protein